MAFSPLLVRLPGRTVSFPDSKLALSLTVERLDILATLHSSRSLLGLEASPRPSQSVPFPWTRIGDLLLHNF